MNPLDNHTSLALGKTLPVPPLGQGHQMETPSRVASLFPLDHNIQRPQMRYPQACAEHACGGRLCPSTMLPKFSSNNVLAPYPSFLLLASFKINPILRQLPQSSNFLLDFVLSPTTQQSISSFLGFVLLFMLLCF